MQHFTLGTIRPGRPIPPETLKNDADDARTSKVAEVACQNFRIYYHPFDAGSSMLMPWRRAWHRNTAQNTADRALYRIKKGAR